MKYLSLAVACLINNTQAIDLKHKIQVDGPDAPVAAPAASATAAAAAADDDKPPKPVAWLKDTLPACPDDKNRTIMDDGKTHIVKFPYVGAVCQLQLEDDIGNSSLVYLYEGDKPAAADAAKNPDLDCKNPSKTDLYKPYVYKAHCMKPPLTPHMENCPIDDKVMLLDGRTKAVPYPKPGFNCNPFGIAAQTPHQLVQTPGDANCKEPFKTQLYKPYEYKGHCMTPPLMASLEGCPIDERKVLKNGVTIAIPYPKKDFNCNPYGIGLAQHRDDSPTAEVGNIPGATPTDPAKTKAACKGVKPFSTDLYKPYSYRGDCLQPPLVPGTMEACPIDERKHLIDGRTLAVPYPKPNYNCNPYGIAAQVAHGLENIDTLSLAEGPKCGGDPFATTLYKPYDYKNSCLNPPLPKELQACPLAESERRVLSDGKTIAVPYPAKGFNCSPYGIGLADQKIVLAQKALDPDAEGKAAIAKDCEGVKPFTTDLYKPYAYKGNCLTPPLVPNIESCPIDDKKHLTDGRTLAIPYPKPGFNCNPYGIAAQSEHVLSQCQEGPEAGPKCTGSPFKTDLYKPYTYSGHCMNPPLLPNVEACPIDERRMLSDGRTVAVPYPAVGYNCNSYGIFSQMTPKDDPSLIQKSMPDSLVQTRSWGPQVLYVPSKGDPSLAPGVDLTKLEHCPDFNERMTLLNGRTLAVSYPNKGFNCNNAWALSHKH